MHQLKNQLPLSISKLFHIAGTIALALLFVTSSANQDSHQNQQAKTWKLEVSACQASEPQSQDDQPWAGNSDAHPLTTTQPAYKGGRSYSHHANQHSYAFSIRAPPQLS
ncbi:hypothetical protein QWY82_14745 [Simiduia curdlanivorans]|uniref:Secreted protein n=1 Tax=Simiduia curdlanivorans TaxID=1492769 RepID=A0ABV8V1R3_9GAMM|nr:hypothetical protein [Simiduia curdlanivorans]MDN3640056.1 hypothetical protein [Simiduia curdlanivorans]